MYYRKNIFVFHSSIQNAKQAIEVFIYVYLLGPLLSSVRIDYFHIQTKKTICLEDNRSIIHYLYEY